MTRKQTIIIILILLILAMILTLFIARTTRQVTSHSIITNTPISLPINTSLNIESTNIEEEVNAEPAVKEAETQEQKPSGVYAEITIQTDKKTRTYDVYPDVEEETLDKHIGHLPSSADPGEIGVCVLMGHRDGNLYILKYAEDGNTVTLKKEDSIFTYKISSIVIQDNAEPLTFNMTSDSALVLVSCYPFGFLGASPQRIIFYCELV